MRIQLTQLKESVIDMEYQHTEKMNVQNISLVPAVSGGMSCYVVEMDLPEGLLTNYKKELRYLPNMTGIADIITENMSLLEWFVMPMRKILKKGVQ